VGVAALAIAGCACARPAWLHAPHLSMPTLSLPGFGSGSKDQVKRVGGVQVADTPEVTDFYSRASGFYQRLEGRRFNSIASFHDAGLREYFASDTSFVDYYSALADELANAAFERSVPISTHVEEFIVDGPGRARVRVRIVGKDGRPMRFWSTAIEREDRWERREGHWWVTAGAS
jgi:hypothetical protein